jgi:hypothetical protein
MGWAVLNGQHHRRAIATQAEALTQRQRKQQDGRQDANLVVRGQQPDQAGGAAHPQQRQDWHRLAAAGVAKKSSGVSRSPATARTSGGIHSRIRCAQG